MCFPAIYSIYMWSFDIFCPSDPTMVHIHFILKSVTWLWLGILIYIGKSIFQQSIAYSMQSSNILCPSGSTMGRIWAKLKPVKFYMYFLRYNFEKLIWTLAWNAVVMSGLVPLFAVWIVGWAKKTDVQDCWFLICSLSWTLGSS